MTNAILPPNKLTFTERRLHATLTLMAINILLVAVGLFLLQPQLGGIMAVVGVCLAIRRWISRQSYNSGMHGTARFASDDDIDYAGLRDRTDGLIVGVLPRSKRSGGPRVLSMPCLPRNATSREFGHCCSGT